MLFFMRKLPISCLLVLLFCSQLHAISSAEDEEEYHRRRRAQRHSAFFYNKYKQEREKRAADSIRLAHVTDSLSTQINQLDLQQKDYDLVKNDGEVKANLLEKEVATQHKKVWWLLGASGFSLCLLGGIMTYWMRKKRKTIDTSSNNLDHLATVTAKNIIILHIRLHQLGEPQNQYQFSHIAQTLREGFDTITAQHAMMKMNSTQRHLTYIITSNKVNMQKVLDLITKMQIFTKSVLGESSKNFVGTTSAIHAGEALVCGNEVWGVAIEIAENLSQQNDTKAIQITQPCLTMLSNDMKVTESGYVQCVFNKEEQIHKVYNISQQ
jgi:hypothetical protein